MTRDDAFKLPRVDGLGVPSHSAEKHQGWVREQEDV